MLNACITCSGGSRLGIRLLSLIITTEFSFVCCHSKDVDRFGCTNCLPRLIRHPIIHNIRAIRNDLQKEIDELKELYGGFRPHLTVVQVGNRDDSSVYVRMKEQAAIKVRL
jgi:hypothetical protein